MAGYGSMAWSQLELHFLGRPPWIIRCDGEIVFFAAAGAEEKWNGGVISGVYAAGSDFWMGLFPGRRVTGWYYICKSNDGVERKHIDGFRFPFLPKRVWSDFGSGNFVLHSPAAAVQGETP